MDTNICEIKDYSLRFFTSLIPLIFEDTSLQNIDLHSNPTWVRGTPLPTQRGQEVREDKNREEGV